MPKIICIVGVTGNQGGSVAQRFLKDTDYHVRGLTRNASSPAAQKLAEQGIEIVQADLDDINTLIPAFKGANIIFSITNYWEPFFRPDCREKAAKEGISCRKFAYDVESRQGKNIADAAATVMDGLDENGFLVSTLSHAGMCSQGKYKELYHFDAKADVFPYYVNEKHPKLAAKMSCVQTGYFTSSYKFIPESYLLKLPDGSFQMSFPTAPDAQIPHLAVNADTGNFVYAVSKLPPGKSYMAEGTTCSWTEYMRLWSRITGVPASYKQNTLEQYISVSRDKEFGRETGDMFEYSSDPGYDGGEALVKAADIRKTVECPMTSLEEWMRSEDWSAVLAQ